MTGYWKLLLIPIFILLLVSCTYMQTDDGIVGTVDPIYLEQRLCAGNMEISSPIMNGQGGETTIYEYRSSDGTILSSQEELRQYEYKRKVDFFRKKYNELEWEDETKFKKDQDIFYQCLTKNKLWDLYYSSGDIVRFVEAKSPWDKKDESLLKEKDRSTSYYYKTFMSPPSIYHYRDRPITFEEELNYELKEIDIRFGSDSEDDTFLDQDNWKGLFLRRNQEKINKLEDLSRIIEQHCPFPKYTPRKYESYGFKESSTRLARSEKFIQHRTLEMSKVQFVPQENPNMCWAASLEMAFSYNGNYYNKNTERHYKQQDFLDTLKSTCLKKLSKKVTVNQMLYAATAVHLSSGGVWLRSGNSGVEFKASLNYKQSLNDFAGSLIKNTLGISSPFSASYSRNGQQWFNISPNQSEDYGQNSLQYLQRQQQLLQQQHQQLFSSSQSTLEPQRYSIPWKTTYSDSREPTEGGIFFAQNTGNILVAISKGYPLIAGRSVDGTSHIVLLTGVVAETAGYCNVIDNNEKKECFVDQNVKIMQFEYLDPMKGDKPIMVDGNDFLASTDFIFYVKP